MLPLVSYQFGANIKCSKMRPDEHKKKKNADYKKKHGIPSSKNAKKNEAKKGKDSEKETAKVETVKDDENTPAESEQEPSKFSRRKVHSNWDRYEDLEFSDEENPAFGVQRRGADFATLLQEAGTSHSQFRFQDEKEWEDNGNDSQAPQAILQINFKDLGESLISIPLHQRLDLGEKEVDFNLLSRSTDNTTNKFPDSENLSNVRKDTSCLAATPAAPTSIPPSEKENTVLPTISFSPSSTKTEKSNDSVMLTRDIPSASRTFKQDEKTVKLIENKKLSFKVDGNSTSISTKRNPPKTGENEFEDELELLLSLDSKQVKTILNRNLDKNEASSDNSSAGDSVVCSSTQNKGTGLKAEETAGKSLAKKEEDLEDWLDSVLG